MAVLPTGIGAQQVFSIFNPGSDSKKIEKKTKQKK